MYGYYVLIKTYKIDRNGIYTQFTAICTIFFSVGVYLQMKRKNIMYEQNKEQTTYNTTLKWDMYENNEMN